MTFLVASYPPMARYSSIISGLMIPQFLSTILVCLPTNVLSFSEISYSSTTLPFRIWLSIISFTFACNTFVYLVIFPSSSYTSTIGSRKQVPTHPVKETVTFLIFLSFTCFSNSIAVFLATVAIPQLPSPTTILICSHLSPFLYFVQRCLCCFFC